MYFAKRVFNDQNLTSTYEEIKEVNNLFLGGAKLKLLNLWASGVHLPAKESAGLLKAKFKRSWGPYDVSYYTKI